MVNFEDWSYNNLEYPKIKLAYNYLHNQVRVAQLVELMAIHVTVMASIPVEVHLTKSFQQALSTYLLSMFGSGCIILWELIAGLLKIHFLLYRIDPPLPILQRSTSASIAKSAKVPPKVWMNKKKGSWMQKLLPQPSHLYGYWPVLCLPGIWQLLLLLSLLFCCAITVCQEVQSFTTI